MKKIKIMVTLLFFGLSVSTNAQFLKKLKAKAKAKVEREAERRAQRRVDKKIDKTFDKAENGVDNTLSKKNKKSTVSTKTFDFTHVYITEYTYKKDAVVFEYFLKNNANYIAVALPNDENKTTTILDLENGKNIMLMENGNQKTQMTMKYNFKKTMKDANRNIEIVKTVNSKQILGYTCYQYIVSGKDFTSKVWVTTEAGINFPKDFYGNNSKKNKNTNWIFKIDGIVLEMTTIDTSRKKPKTTKMLCTKLAKQPVNLDASAYKKMF